jgi:cardiolipin synthase
MWNFIQEHIWQIAITINYLLVASAIITILLKNINPSKTLAYILALALLPFIGLVVYYLFGREYYKTVIYKKKNVLNQTNIKKWRQALTTNLGLENIDDENNSDKLKLIKILHTSQDAPLTKHNRVEILLNGEAKFKRLFHDIKEAKKTIHLEYYILVDDNLGTKLVNLLCEKAKQGVAVRLSYDYVGSSISSKTKKKLSSSGVEFYAFMPVYFPKFTSKLNYRNHRKIAVIDGSVGYVGGINVSDNYVNNEPGIFWRDTHLRIEGEAVGSLQLHFLLNWDFVNDYDITIEDHFFPKNTVTNHTEVQIAASGPDTEEAHIMDVIFTAITNANKYVYITTPYFIPNDEIVFALQTAVKSGIEVKLLIPKESDSWIAKYATNSYIESLLEVGADVYFYTKGFVHAKMMIVDGVFTTIGTANMDYRSFNINFEINALVYDETTAQKALEAFTEDLNDSELVNYKRWKERSGLRKIQESLARLTAPLL